MEQEDDDSLAELQDDNDLMKTFMEELAQETKQQKLNSTKEEHMDEGSIQQDDEDHEGIYLSAHAYIALMAWQLKNKNNLFLRKL